MGMQDLSIEANPNDPPHYQDLRRQRKELQAVIQKLTQGVNAMDQQIVDMEEEEALQELGVANAREVDIWDDVDEYDLRRVMEEDDSRIPTRIQVIIQDAIRNNNVIFKSFGWYTSNGKRVFLVKHKGNGLLCSAYNNSSFKRLNNKRLYDLFDSINPYKPSGEEFYGRPWVSRTWSKIRNSPEKLLKHKVALVKFLLTYNLCNIVGDRIVIVH